MQLSGFLRMLSLVICVIFPCNIYGQRGYTARTAEYLAATSDLIVRAVVTDLKTEKHVPKDGNNELGAANFRDVTVLLNVTRCLKGETDGSIKFRITEPAKYKRLEEWKNSKLELFWFFNFAEVDENGIREIVPRSDFELWESYVEPPDLTADRPPIMLLNVNLQPLTTVTMVENTIIDYVKRFGNEKITGTRIPISREIAWRTRMAQAANMVLLPKNYEELQSK